MMQFHSSTFSLVIKQDWGALEDEVFLELMTHLTLKAEGVLCLRKESRQGTVLWLGGLDDPL